MFHIGQYSRNGILRPSAIYFSLISRTRVSKRARARNSYVQHETTSYGFEFKNVCELSTSPYVCYVNVLSFEQLALKEDIQR